MFAVPLGRPDRDGGADQGRRRRGGAGHRPRARRRSCCSARATTAAPCASGAARSAGSRWTSRRPRPTSGAGWTRSASGPPPSPTWRSTSADGDLGAALDAAGHDRRRTVALRVRGPARLPDPRGGGVRCARPCAPGRPQASVLVADFLVSPEPGAPARALRAAIEHAAPSVVGEPGATSSAPGTPRSSWSSPAGASPHSESAGGEQARPRLAHAASSSCEPERPTRRRVSCRRPRAPSSAAG